MRQTTLHGGRSGPGVPQRRLGPPEPGTERGHPRSRTLAAGCHGIGLDARFEPTLYATALDLDWQRNQDPGIVAAPEPVGTTPPPPLLSGPTLHPRQRNAPPGGWRHRTPPV